MLACVGGGVVSVEIEAKPATISRGDGHWAILGSNNTHMWMWIQDQCLATHCTIPTLLHISFIFIFFSSYFMVIIL
jgi:hypothetical protein